MQKIKGQKSGRLLLDQLVLKRRYSLGKIGALSRPLVLQACGSFLMPFRRSFGSKSKNSYSTVSECSLSQTSLPLASSFSHRPLPSSIEWNIDTDLEFANSISTAYTQVFSDLNRDFGSPNFGHSLKLACIKILYPFLDEDDHVIFGIKERNKVAVKDALYFCRKLIHFFWSKGDVLSPESLDWDERSDLVNILLRGYMASRDWRSFDKMVQIVPTDHRGALSFILELKSWFVRHEQMGGGQEKLESKIVSLLETICSVNHFFHLVPLILESNYFTKQEVSIMTSCLSPELCNTLNEYHRDSIFLDTRADQSISNVPSKSDMIPEIKSVPSSFNMAYLKQALKSLSVTAREDLDSDQLQQSLERDCMIAMRECAEFMFRNRMGRNGMHDTRFVNWIFQYITPKIVEKIAALRQISDNQIANMNNSHMILIPASVTNHMLAMIGLTQMLGKSQDYFVRTYRSCSYAIGECVRNESMLYMAGKNFIYPETIKSLKKRISYSTGQKKSEQKNDELFRYFLAQRTDSRKIGLHSEWSYADVFKIGQDILEIILQNCGCPISVFKSDGFRKNLDELPANEKMINIFTINALHVKNSMYKTNCIILEPMFLEKILDFRPFNAKVDASIIPMVVPPKPWIDFSDGGYYLIKQNLVRQLPFVNVSKGSVSASIRSGQLCSILQTLDNLGSVPWLINEKVLRVMIEAWNSNLIIGKLQNDKYMMESLGSSAREKGKWSKSENSKLYHEDPKSYFESLRAETAENNEKSSIHSMRCDLNYKLEIARVFAGRPMYFPHNLDFRGRCYSIPVYFNHMGHDVCRGLMLFKEGHELGSTGIRWLLIQLANMFGEDKLSFEDRVAFSLSHRDDVIDSADNPLGGRKWWCSGENPWQTLAVCIELTNAWNHPEGPEKFVSHIPCQMDGSCNGLQHYAALGRDESGGNQVNLIPRERPMDVYAAIAASVNEFVERDNATIEESRESGIEGQDIYSPGVEAKTPILLNLIKDSPDDQSETDKANVIIPEQRIITDHGSFHVKAVEFSRGKISRKVVKQTIMTTVYGVTKYGAKLQVLKRLKEQYGKGMTDEEVKESAQSLMSNLSLEFGEEENDNQVDDLKVENAFSKEDSKGVPEKLLNESAKYISSLVFESLGTYFESAQEHQKWLVRSADEICRSIPRVDLLRSEDAKPRLAPWLDILNDEEKEVAKSIVGNIGDRMTSFSESASDDFEDSDSSVINGAIDRISSLVSKSIDAANPSIGSATPKKAQIAPIFFLMNRTPRLKELYESWLDRGLLVEARAPLKKIRQEYFPKYPNQTVKWVTPLGLPVVQPYYKNEERSLRSVPHQIRVRKSYHEVPLSITKQKGAIPPNFVHSLDASHMIMTAEAFFDHFRQLSRERLSDDKHDNSFGEAGEEDYIPAFAHVHDCFWTHANRMDVLHHLCREAFVKLHERPIFSDLLGYFQSMDGYGDSFVPVTMKPADKSSFETLHRELNQLIEKIGREEGAGDSGELKVMHKWCEIFEGLKGKRSKRLLVFRPLRFESLPKTGNLDLKGVLDSKYFFA